jgi:hypothetical protein
MEPGFKGLVKSILGRSPEPTESGFRSGLLNPFLSLLKQQFGVLWLCEMAFLRNSSSLLKALTSYE